MIESTSTMIKVHGGDINHDQQQIFVAEIHNKLQNEQGNVHGVLGLLAKRLLQQPAQLNDPDAMKLIENIATGTDTSISKEFLRTVSNAKEEELQLLLDNMKNEFTIIEYYLNQKKTASYWKALQIVYDAVGAFISQMFCNKLVEPTVIGTNK
jgi:UDP-glucose 6-dehydrogenase